MQLHTDFSQRVVIQIEDLPWQDSPLVGVQRRMLGYSNDVSNKVSHLLK